MSARRAADEISTELGVAPAAAWEILTCPEGAQLWLGDGVRRWIEVGTTIAVRGFGAASVVAAVPPSDDGVDAGGGQLGLRFADGSEATFCFEPLPRRGNGAERAATRLRLARPGIGGAAAVGWLDLIERAALCVARAGVARKPRQAVLVVHGIGSQRPLATARRFTDLLADRSERWSKPDRLSGSAELRRFQLRRSRNRPRTDIYELYWADKVPGTAMRQITAWLLTLLRRPSEVSPALRPVLALLGAALVLAVAALVVAALTLGVDRLHGWWKSATGLAGASLAAAFISGALVKSVGDAARYLDDAPDNIAVRQSIREAGLEMLRKLHREEHYDRVVVVGHSLGSVIAYDVLRQFWAETCDAHGYPLHPTQAVLKAYVANVGAATREDQQALWEENRRLGAPWLVTDLVTFGSPLTHATSLLARSRADLEERRRELALPTCPPRPDGKTFTQAATYVVDGQRRTVQTLTHGCLFAVTRWTNLYAPVRGGFFGDLVGGPVAQEFGSGVSDVPVRVDPWWRRRTLLAHTAYWLSGTSSAKLLVDAVDVDSAPWLDRHTAAMPWRTTVAAATAEIERHLAR